VKYVILIYSNADSRRIWEGFSDTERGEGLRHYAGIVEDLAASGELIVTEALAEPSRGTSVRVANGTAMATDGPFGEAKEHLAGFFLIDTASRERAIEIAGRVPEAALGLVEVRPIMVYSGLEM
jgi:hypothetical protein